MDIEFKSYSSTEEMQADIAAKAKVAAEGLHPAQKALSLGDHWVQFYELDANPPFIIFGRVVTDRECYDQWDAEDDDGPQGEAAARERSRLSETHVMYGWAASAQYAEGEWGYTHKASVWPIDEVLFNMAKAVDWNINRLDPSGRYLLELAFQGQRAHVLAQAADMHDTKPTRQQVGHAIAQQLPTASNLDSEDIERMVDAVMALL